jgi:hypothetical protein
MPTRRSLVAIAGSLTLCALLWTTARSQNPLPPILGAVLVGRDAYVLQPPEMIAGGNVIRHSVSSSGAFVLAVRRTPPRLPASLTEKSSPNTAEISLHLWDTAERKGAVLWRDTSTERVPVGLSLEGFFPNTNLALIRVSRGSDARPEGSRFFLVNAGKRTVREIASGPLDDRLILSRSQPRAAIFSETDRTMRIIREDGGISQSFPLAVPGWDGGFLFWFWHKDGKNLVGWYAGKDENDKPKKMAVLLDSDTGKRTPHDPRPNQPESEKDSSVPPPPIQIHTDKGEVKREDTQVNLTPLWLVGTGKDAEGRALLTANGSRPELLSRAALFYSAGALYAAPLQRIDRETYVAMRRQQWRMQAMTNAKQIGLGMMMYAQDYDGNFPSPDGNLKEVVNPYLKNDSLWNNPETGRFGFQAAYKQTTLSGFSSPSTTALGYLTGPGGRAVIYVDGHVKWEDENP